MIHYTEFTLSNGLEVIHHQDTSTQLCALNILYKVGSRNENPEHTGFEHLMFGGSINIEDFDGELQKAGGESNAFTSNDITNYYVTLPANNIETGFWLESDRMLQLNFSQKSLDVQKGVVIEEFKERYRNQPYGDLWLHTLPLAYKSHPYHWPTIGKSIEHMEKTSLEDVKAFFNNFYAPNNATLVVAGNISLDETKRLCEKWFEPIPSKTSTIPKYPVEPKQTQPRMLEVEADVPIDLILKAYKMGGRLDPDYFCSDLLSDILGSGRSARLYNALVKEQAIFSEIDAYISGDVDPGLFLIEGKLQKGISFEQAENAIQTELNKLIVNNLGADELTKVINKTETNILFGDVNILNRAMKLAFAKFMGDIELVNTEIISYQSVTVDQIRTTATNMFREENCSTIYYKSKTNA